MVLLLEWEVTHLRASQLSSYAAGRGFSGASLWEFNNADDDMNTSQIGAADDNFTYGQGPNLGDSFLVVPHYLTPVSYTHLTLPTN